MDAKVLESIGLSGGESRVYLALIKLGEAKTGVIAKEAQVSSSKVYKILDRLIVKGLAGFVLKGKTKYFSAMDPKRVIDYMNEQESDFAKKKEEVEKIIPFLQKEQKLDKISAVTYEGFKAITNFFREIISELNKGEEYYALSATYGEVPGLRDFLQGHHKRRIAKGIRLKMLANYETRNNIEPATKKLAEIKYLPSYLSSNMEIIFYKNKAFIIIMTKVPTGLLLENPEAVKGFKTYFEGLWKIAKD